MKKREFMAELNRMTARRDRALTGWKRCEEYRDTYERRLAEVDDERRKLSAEVAKWRSVSESMGRFNEATSRRNENQRKIIRDLKKRVRELEDRCREAEDRLVEVADIADRRSEAKPPLDVKSGVRVQPSPFDFPINTGIVSSKEWRGKGQSPPAKWFNQPGGRPS